MIKQLCSYMFGGHKECEEKLHNSSLTLLNQIQELKSINNYQTMELEQNIKELQAELIHERWTTCKGDHSLIYKDLGQSLHIRDLEQKIKHLEEDIEELEQKQIKCEWKEGIPHNCYWCDGIYPCEEDFICCNHGADDVSCRGRQYRKGLMKKIADLEREMESNQQLYDEEYKKNIRLHERLDSLQTDNDSLKQQLECSQREVSTLSGVLNSEPIMEALGVKDDNNA